MYTTVYTLAFDGHVGRSRVLNPAPLYFFDTYHQSNWCCSECRVMKTLFLSHEKHEKTVKICWCSECRVMKTLLLSHEKTVWNEVRTNNIGRDDATHTRYVRPKNWQIPSQKGTCIQQCTCLLVIVQFLKHTKKELLSFQSGDVSHATIVGSGTVAAGQQRLRRACCPLCVLLSYSLLCALLRTRLLLMGMSVGREFWYIPPK